MIEISKQEARRVLLDRQGLIRRAPFGRGKNAVQKTIEQLSYIQIDTISVVDRAHHHVLKTRVPNYDEKMLDRLQSRDRTVFEYWAHAAAYLPMADFRYYLPMMQGWRKHKKWDRKLAAEIRRRIESEGPLSSRHFEDHRGEKSNGWWDWKPAKLALENMFLAGEVMVARREGFQKVYDLPENVLPENLDTSPPDHNEWVRFLALRNLRAAGIGKLNDVAYARTSLSRFTRKALRNDIKGALDELAEDGCIEKISVQGDEGWYADPAALDVLPVRLGRKQLHVLSPFDNVVINRARMQALFDFDYQIECYVPAPKRQYGYFCLPLLWGDEFIGRVDAKANRKTRELEIKGLFFEPRVKKTPALDEAVSTALTEFAARNDCDTVAFD